MPSRDTFGLTSLEKCARSNVLIGNINLLPFDGPGGEGGGGAKKKFLYEEAPPRGPTTYTFMYFF